MNSMSQASAAMPAQNLNRIDGSTLGLYAATVFLWGVSWIGIRAQLGVVAPEMSVLWRFLLAAGGPGGARRRDRGSGNRVPVLAGDHRRGLQRGGLAGPGALRDGHPVLL